MIEFLFWEGCPSHERALAELTSAMDHAGVANSELRVTEVFSEDDASREQFVGSPTIRIDGQDLVDPGQEPLGLNCRIYFRRDGRASPLPDKDDLREAITRYANRSE